MYLKQNIELIKNEQFSNNNEIQLLENFSLKLLIKYFLKSMFKPGFPLVFSKILLGFPNFFRILKVHIFGSIFSLKLSLR